MNLTTLFRWPPALGCILLLLQPCFAAGTADSKVAQLSCEGRSDPLGVDLPQPRLGWQLQSAARNVHQVAWQVLAASTPELLARDQGDLWDSGRVESDATLQVPYAGKALATDQVVFWKVRSWLTQGSATGAKAQATEWSPVASWTMGVIVPADWLTTLATAPAGWQAEWIGAPANGSIPLPLFRHGFDVAAGLRRATVNICGLGQYELSLNGRKVGDDLLTPGWTKYDKTCLYDTYDVTALLHAGANAAGIVLGNGMYNLSPEAVGKRYKKFTGSFGPPKVIAQLRLEYADGRVVFVGTGDPWQVAASPLTFSTIYGGEDYDARREVAGWDTAAFDGAGWVAATVVAGPGGELRGLSAAAPPVTAHEVFKPARVTELRPGVTLYDFGQNAAQLPRLRVHGPAGAVVRLTPAELLKANGNIDPGSSGNGLTWMQYTLRGDPDGESWSPKFFYIGCRYLLVECERATDVGERPIVSSLESVVVHSASTPVGEFACSNDLFNRIHSLILWAQRSNLVSVMTDCPHRERLGWLEQDYLNGPSLRYEFDLAPLTAKVLNDIADSQLRSGLVPSIAPEYTAFTDRTSAPGTRNAFGDSPEWGSALVQCAWQQYLWTGDTGVLARFYEPMKRYADYLGTRRNSDGLINYGLGDWYDLGPAKPGKAQLTPVALTATATYYADLVVLEKTARLLGRADDATAFAALAKDTREAFNHAFYHADRGSYATGSQTANAMPLVLGLADPAQAPRVLDALATELTAHGNTLTAGDVGYTYLLRALAAGGRSDLIYAMNNQSDRPGYGYQLAHGATALTEAWNALSSSSQDHFMLGHIMEWFYRDLAGIGADPDGPGFKKILIRPTVLNGMDWARANYDSVRGRITSAWKCDDLQFTLHVIIPANTTAMVVVPTADPAAVQEGGRSATTAEGVAFLRAEKGAAVFTVGSGDYTFTSTLP